MEPYFWLVIIALVFTILSTFVSLGNIREPNVGRSRLNALTAIVATLLLLASVIWYFVAGIEVTITRV